MEDRRLTNVQKIAILRALVLGDLIFSLPALNALHQTYPEADITLLSRPWAADFFKDRIPGVSRVITFRSSPYGFEDLGFLIHPEDASWFFPQMQAENFDIAISMQGGGKNSNPFIQRLNAGLNIGSREGGAIPLNRWIAHDYYQHDVIRNLDLARLAGARVVVWNPELQILPTDLEAAEPFLKNIDRPYVVIHSGARDIRRRWPPEKFAVVADWIKRKLGLEVVLTGTAVETQSTLLLENAMQETAINLSHQLTLPALVGVLAKSALILSNDTGVLHLGLAVGAKGVGLFWSEYISKSMPLSRKCFTPVISWERHCPLCGMFLNQKVVVRSDVRPCLHLTSFLNSISPEQVFEQVEKMIEGFSTAS